MATNAAQSSASTPACTSQSQRTKVTFFDLPAEIRLHIYGTAYLHGREYKEQGHGGRALAFLETCRQIYDEASEDLLYGHRTFKIEMYRKARDRNLPDIIWMLFNFRAQPLEYNELLGDRASNLLLTARKMRHISLHVNTRTPCSEVALCQLHDTMIAFFRQLASRHSLKTVDVTLAVHGIWETPSNCAALSFLIGGVLVVQSNLGFDKVRFNVRSNLEDDNHRDNDHCDDEFQPVLETQCQEYDPMKVLDCSSRVVKYFIEAIPLGQSLVQEHNQDLDGMLTKICKTRLDRDVPGFLTSNMKLVLSLHSLAARGLAACVYMPARRNASRLLQLLTAIDGYILVIDYHMGDGLYLWVDSTSSSCSEASFDASQDPKPDTSDEAEPPPAERAEQVLKRRLPTPEADSVPAKRIKRSKDRLSHVQTKAEADWDYCRRLYLHPQY